MVRITGSAAAVFALLLTHAFAQAPAFTLVPKADIEKVQQAIADGYPNDAPVRMVDVGGRFHLGVYTLNTPPTQPSATPNAPVMGFYHNDIAEIYIIVSGAGTWRVGGTLEDPKVDDLTARSVKEVRGPGVVGVLKGFTNQKISAGDVLIVPPGVPHSPGEMSERIKIVRVVLDPHKVLPVFPKQSPAEASATSEAQPRKTPAGTPAPKLPGTFTFIPKASIETAFKQVATQSAADLAIRVLDLANLDYRVGVYAARAGQAPKGPSSITELYYLKNAGDVLIVPNHATPTPLATAAGDVIRIAIDPGKTLPLKK